MKLNSLSQTFVGLVILAALTVFGYTGKLNQADTYTTLMAIIGLVGASGLWILASESDNANAIPHVFLGCAFIGVVIALGVHNVFNSGQIQAIFAVLITGGAVTTGTVVATSAIKSAALKANRAELPPAPKVD